MFKYARMIFYTTGRIYYMNCAKSPRVVLWKSRTIEKYRRREDLFIFFFFCFLLILTRVRAEKNNLLLLLLFYLFVNETISSNKTQIDGANGKSTFYHYCTTLRCRIYSSSIPNAKHKLLSKNLRSHYNTIIRANYM